MTSDTSSTKFSCKKLAAGKNGGRHALQRMAVLRPMSDDQSISVTHIFLDFIDVSPSSMCRNWTNDVCLIVFADHFFPNSEDDFATYADLCMPM